MGLFVSIQGSGLEFFLVAVPSAAAVAIPPSMPFPQLDASIAKVRAAAPEFAKVSIDERIAMLERMRIGYREISEESVKLACAAKGIDFHSPTAG